MFTTCPFHNHDRVLIVQSANGLTSAIDIQMLSDSPNFLGSLARIPSQLEFIRQYPSDNSYSYLQRMIHVRVLDRIFRWNVNVSLAAASELHLMLGWCDCTICQQSQRRTSLCSCGGSRWQFEPRVRRNPGGWLSERQKSPQQARPALTLSPRDKLLHKATTYSHKLKLSECARIHRQLQLQRGTTQAQHARQL